jgi:hypothetical protein
MTMLNLTGNTALDVAIGLSFVYLLFSILCSAVQEAIAGILDLRADTLEKGLRNLLDDDGEPGGGGAPKDVRAAAPSSSGPVPESAGGPGASAPQLTDRLLGHGLVRTQYRAARWLRRGRRGPSYIPSRTFALALLDVVAPADEGAMSTPSLQTAIANTHIPPGTKNALLALARSAGNDRDKFRILVEHWFNGAMDRVSGWYKRRSQVVICALSLLVAVGLNVNTVAIAERLGRDDAVRAAVVEQASKTTAKPGDSLNTVATDVSKVRELGLPLGWSKKDGDPVKADLRDHPFRTIGGWLLTFLALSLGAPFWFGTLGRLTNLRNSGAPPAKPSAAGA